jgi:hypothetical protein
MYRVGNSVALRRLTTFATTIALVLGNAVLANADSRGINFEPTAYSPGSIQGQQGWGGQTPPGIPINPLIDQAIVTNGPGAPASFGKQSWRISNAVTLGSFGDMPFSPSLANEAGETLAQNSTGVVQFSGGTRQNHFDVQWSFTSADPTGPGTDCSTNVACSYLSMAPDRGDGARMSYIRLEDDFTGLRVFFDDYQDKAPYGSLATPALGCGPEDDFTDTMVASNLLRNKAHTVRLSIDFKDGPRNDVVKVFVDGTLRLTGTTWEDYFRWCPESGGGVPNDAAADQSRTVDSMIFTVRNGTFQHPLNFGKGFLIDNLFYSSSRSGGECDGHHGDGDGDVDNGAGGHGHAQFHKDGCDKRDGDSVRHDDDQAGHHFQSTSVDSAQFSTAADGRTMTATGTGVDNGLPVGFTMIAVDHDGLLPATYSILLTNGYTFIGTFVSGLVTIQ